MPRPKSLISTKVRFDVAINSHNCQHVPSHRVKSGDRRLKIPSGRSFEHYCIICARTLIERDIGQLQGLLREANTT